jgi:dGTPase
VALALGLNEDLVEALALVHDIGHPPFGHAGEHKLDALMRTAGEAFDHNLHALRIVERFEQRYAAFPGLNLTFEVREGIVKHSRDYDPASYPELADYRLGERPSLEAQLIDRADEIAYNAADLDDGMEARLLDPAALRDEVSLYRALAEDVRQRFPDAPAKLQFNETLKRIIDRLTTDLIAATRQALADARVDSVEAVRAHPRRLAAFSDDGERWNRELKQFLHRRLYNHPQILEERERAIRVVEELFQHYVREPGRLPRQYAEQAQREPAHRVACDYIAGMTDNYTFRVHAEIFGTEEARAGRV